jgi:hypothetical protein
VTLHCECRRGALKWCSNRVSADTVPCVMLTVVTVAARSLHSVWLEGFQQNWESEVFGLLLPAANLLRLQNK